MPQILNYLKKLDFFFEINDGFNKNMAENKFIYPKENYTLLIEKKRGEHNSWLKFLKNAQSELSSLRFRDFSETSLPHAFVGMFIDDKRGKGFYLSISFLTNEYGFYYAEYQYEKDDSEKIKNYTCYQMEDTQIKKDFELIEKIIPHHFPNFKLFNNSLANYTINNIIVYGICKWEIELWEVIFGIERYGLL